jgi:hypothetical protein
MLAFPEMLLGAAEEAGMKVPPDANDFKGEEYPHFAVFCGVQLGSPMPHSTAHWDNAKVIAAVPEDKIRNVTFNDLVAAGLAVGYPWP